MSGTGKDQGASASGSGSRPSDQAPSGVDASRVDPSRGAISGDQWAVILEWYQWLPKQARRQLSFHHLHVLAKRLHDEESGTACPICSGASAFSGDPAERFCDEHYRQYLLTFQVQPSDLAAYRAEQLTAKQGADAGGGRP